MHKIITTILFLTISLQIFSQVKISGNLETQNRIRIQNEGEFTWNKNSMGLKFEGNPSGDIHYFSEISLFSLGIPQVNQTSDLQDKDIAYTWGLEINELYLDMYCFLSDNLDIRIGKQIIAWGTADKLNPTDNLNPDDMSDIFDFGKHSGSNSMMLAYYLGDYTLYGVFVPVFQPSTLPSDDWSKAFNTPLDTPTGMNVVSFEDNILLPKNELTETSSYGFKIAGNMLDYDLSASYYYGRDDMPLLSSVKLNAVDTLENYDAEAELVYPRIQVFGADIAGSIGKVGVWGEAALIFPEEQKLKFYVNSALGGESVILEDKPFIRFVVGGDYTFKNNVYLNAQYMHGYIHERGVDELNDYFILRLERKFMYDKLNLAPVSAMVEIPDWDDIENIYGIALGSEISYYPYDAFEITLGSYILDGKGNSIFSKAKENDEIFFKLKYSF